MYIRLTRLDNSPIWINATFVVTVEPRKGGGSVVVPIGDGLDYEVRETADAVLAMLDGAPAPAVVPVPAPKMLAPTPEDVSPDSDPPGDVSPDSDPPGDVSSVGISVDGPKPVRRTRRLKKTVGPTDEETEDKPAKRTRRPKKAVAEDGAATKPSVDFSDAQFERLKKMAPGSMRKLLNTLLTQFKVADAEAVVDSLRDRGLVVIEHQHVIWP